MKVVKVGGTNKDLGIRAQGTSGNALVGKVCGLEDRGWNIVKLLEGQTRGIYSMLFSDSSLVKYGCVS